MISRQNKICCIILIILGIIAYMITFYIYKDFIFAKNKVITESMLVNVNESSEQRLKKKEDRDNDPLHKYYTYYEYELTYEFENPLSGNKHQYINETGDISKKSYEIGQKETIVIYYNNDESDYGFADPFGAIIFLAAGTILIIIAIVDIIRIRKKTKKAAVPVSEKHKRVKPKNNSKFHSINASAVIIFHSEKGTLNASPENSFAVKTLLNLLSKEETNVLFKENEKGELTCSLPWRTSVSPSLKEFSNGDIIIYKDKMGIVCNKMNTYAVRFARINNYKEIDIKDFFTGVNNVSISIEWSE